MKLSEYLDTTGNSEEKEINKLSVEDFGSILSYYQLKYTSNEYRLQVGAITKTQGWVLHISAVISQIINLLHVVIPFLSEESVPFKIPDSLVVCDDILSGNLGINQIGKIISVYPNNDDSAVLLAEKLIHLTQAFTGPSIATDCCLGGIVYTRYGSFAPIIRVDASGNKEKYIYDYSGNLVKDPYNIPFRLPECVTWPFEKLTKVTEPTTFKYSHRVKPLSILKSDMKGNVYKGVYLVNLLTVKKCVIKQGFKCMTSDLSGRDIRDRLIWQKELHETLYGYLPVPKIYNFFEQDGITYLAMEYIKGVSLFDKLIQLNPTSKSCLEFSPAHTRQIFNYIINVASIVGKLHRRGYVHRDIVPVNFLIDSYDRINLIDLELTYSLNQDLPNPPFTWGTPGFMSPEQKAAERPTVKEDIYALGACLVQVFSGLTPIKFNAENKAIFLKQLLFFIRSSEMTSLIADCLDNDPVARPTIEQILHSLSAYEKEIICGKFKISVPFDGHRDAKLINFTISKALNGLTREPIPFKNGLWYSSKRNVATGANIKSKQYTVYSYLREGIGGTLYMLSRLQKSGINVDSCKNAYFDGWQYVKQSLSDETKNLVPGLYDGTFGIALIIAEGLKSKLMTDSDLLRNMLERCISVPPTVPNMAAGLAGQGVALLRCQRYLDSQIFDSLIDSVKAGLLSAQNIDGSWKCNCDDPDVAHLLSFGYGIPGIVWFLLEYGQIYNDTVALRAGKRSLDWIAGNKQLNNRIANWPRFNKEVKGSILVLLKGYEVLKDSGYRALAEDALANYPPHLIKLDFTQKSGMAGMGELYLEAYRVLKDEKWLTQANWIANVLLNTFFDTDENSGYWVLDDNSPPTADLVTGISGIIHFLSRFISKSNIGYPLLK